MARLTEFINRHAATPEGRLKESLAMTASAVYIVCFIMGGIDGGYSNKIIGKGYYKACDNNR
jgi:hypothetical protein